MTFLYMFFLLPVDTYLCFTFLHMFFLFPVDTDMCFTYLHMFFFDQPKTGLKSLLKINS
jgi:hypothetical protein